jgi:hypothetical protein
VLPASTRPGGAEPGVISDGGPIIVITAVIVAITPSERGK